MGLPCIFRDQHQRCWPSMIKRQHCLILTEVFRKRLTFMGIIKVWAQRTVTITFLPFITIGLVVLSWRFISLSIPLNMVKVKRFGMNFIEFLFFLGQVGCIQDICFSTEINTLSCVRGVPKGFSFLACRQWLTFMGKILALPKKHSFAPNCLKLLRLRKIRV